MNAIAIARAALAICASYLVCGAVIAVPFVALGVNRVDPAAREASVAFRLLILPGSVLLWPFVVLRWRAAERDETQT